jgi:hypothetical protein
MQTVGREGKIVEIKKAGRTPATSALSEFPFSLVVGAAGPAFCRESGSTFLPLTLPLYL